METPQPQRQEEAMGNGADDRLAAIKTEADAWARGYEGEACSECGNFTMLVVGQFTMRCDTCGTTMGIDRDPQKGELKPSRIEQHFACEAVDETGVPLHSPDGC